MHFSKRYYKHYYTCELKMHSIIYEKNCVHLKCTFFSVKWSSFNNNNILLIYLKQLFQILSGVMNILIFWFYNDIFFLCINISPSSNASIFNFSIFCGAKVNVVSTFEWSTFKSSFQKCLGKQKIKLRRNGIFCRWHLHRIFKYYLYIILLI